MRDLKRQRLTTCNSRLENLPKSEEIQKGNLSFSEIGGADPVPSRQVTEPSNLTFGGKHLVLKKLDQIPQKISKGEILPHN